MCVGTGSVGSASDVAYSHVRCGEVLPSPLAQFAEGHTQDVGLLVLVQQLHETQCELLDTLALADRLEVHPLDRTDGVEEVRDDQSVHQYAQDDRRKKQQ